MKGQFKSKFQGTRKKKNAVVEWKENGQKIEHWTPQPKPNFVDYVVTGSFGETEVGAGRFDGSWQLGIPMPFLQIGSCFADSVREQGLF